MFTCKHPARTAAPRAPHRQPGRTTRRSSPDDQQSSLQGGPHPRTEDEHTPALNRQARWPTEHRPFLRQGGTSRVAASRAPRTLEASTKEPVTPHSYPDDARQPLLKHGSASHDDSRAASGHTPTSDSAIAPSRRSAPRGASRGTRLTRPTTSTPSQLHRRQLRATSL